MQEMGTRFKALMAPLVAWATAALGWRASLVVVWVAAMALDYLSGTCAACRHGEWSSTTARQGLWHKGGMILVVTVAAISDFAVGALTERIQLGFRWPGILLGLVLAWYIITELGSIVENAVQMGAAVPRWMTRMLKAAQDAVDKAGECSASEMEDRNDRT